MGKFRRRINRSVSLIKTVKQAIGNETKTILFSKFKMAKSKTKKTDDESEEDTTILLEDDSVFSRDLMLLHRYLVEFASRVDGLSMKKKCIVGVLVLLGVFAIFLAIFFSY